MSLRTRNGRMLVRSGHWCTTCCGHNMDGCPTEICWAMREIGGGGETWIMTRLPEWRCFYTNTEGDNDVVLTWAVDVQRWIWNNNRLYFGLQRWLGPATKASPVGVYTHPDAPWAIDVEVIGPCAGM